MRIVAETDRAGRTTRTTYDDQRRPLTVTDPLGATTTYAYDDLGRPLSVERPDGTTASITYDEAGNPVELRDPDGAVTRHAYDEAGRLVGTTRPDSTTTALAYDSSVRLAAVTDPLGQTTRVESNPAGLPSRVADPLGSTTTYHRDALGRPTVVTDPLGNTTLLSWTVEGKLARRTAADGAAESWEWDGEGNLLRHTDPACGVTEYTYTHFDLLEARTDPDGARQQFAYDLELRLRQVTNPQGLTSEYEYDPTGLVVGEQDFDGRRLYYTHDEAGSLSMRSNMLGQSVTYQRDLLGRILSKNVDGDETLYTYDPAGRLITAETLDSELVLQRDRMGRLRTEMYEGRVLAFDRDELGRPVRRTTPAGAVTAYAYDVAGNRIGLDFDGHTLGSAFDAVGRETSRHVDTALSWANQWDPAGRLVAQTVTADGVTGDPRGMDGGSGVVQPRSYEYRPDGYLTGLTDHLNGSRRFRLDRVGRITQVTGHDWTETYAYDAAGNVARADWPASHGEGATGSREYSGTRVTRAGRWTYIHDEAGRVVEWRKTRLSRKPDVWRYEWDAEDRLTTCTTPDGTVWTYRYDPLGRRSAKQRLGTEGRVIEETVFTWDGTQVIEQCTTGITDRPIALTWEYNGLAAVAQAERAFDPNDQQAVDTRFFAIVTDLVGTPTELVTPDGDLVWRTRSTLWGTTAVARGATAHTPLRHPGQYADAETGFHYNLNRHYDPVTARYASPDPLGLAPAPNPVAWVGNPHRWTDPLGLQPCGPGIDDDTYDRLDSQYGTHVADGVDHNLERMNDGTPNGPDHGLAGIGSDPDKLARYLSDHDGQATHADTKTGARVEYDKSRVDGQGRGVLIVQTPYRVHAYHYSEEAFNSGRYTPL